jgi:hypothetical protein
MHDIWVTRVKGFVVSVRERRRSSVPFSRAYLHNLSLSKKCKAFYPDPLPVVRCQGKTSRLSYLYQSTSHCLWTAIEEHRKIWLSLKEGSLKKIDY